MAAASSPYDIVLQVALRALCHLFTSVGVRTFLFRELLAEA